MFHFHLSGSLGDRKFNKIRKTITFFDIERRLLSKKLSSFLPRLTKMPIYKLKRAIDFVIWNFNFWKWIFDCKNVRNPKKFYLPSWLNFFFLICFIFSIETFLVNLKDVKAKNTLRTRVLLNASEFSDTEKTKSFSMFFSQLSFSRFF